MEEIYRILDERNISGLTRDILLSQPLTKAEVLEILDCPQFKLSRKPLNGILERIHGAKERQEGVMIAGDYDADGIMATTILLKGLKEFGIDAGFYIPDRIKEGYGLSCETVKLAAEKNYSLIITVDNGVVAFDALDLAKELGVDVIVTDHHSLSDKAYEFDYLLHPSYLDEGFQDLSGAGLALILIETLLNKSINEYYVYAMVATLADMVSVFGHNRYIIKRGLKVLNEEGQAHIEHLIHYQNGAIDQTTISFQVVPKLNTAGRLADRVNVNNIVRYFMLEHPLEIEKVAKDITALNRERIDLTKKSFEALETPLKVGALNVILSDSIHEGLTGLVANRYLSHYAEPVIVLTRVGDLYKGSGRAPEGFDLHQTLKVAEDYYQSFGGHTLACGLSFKENDLKIILKNLEKNGQDFKGVSHTNYSLNLNIDELSLKTVTEVEALAPFGIDFKKPDFIVNVEVTEKPLVMAKRHLKWRLSDQVELLYFSLSADKVSAYQELEHLKARVSMSLNEFRGKQSVSLIIEELLRNDDVE